MNGSAALVAECASTACPLHPYRHGRKPKDREHHPTRAMRQHCLECTGKNAAEVRRCKNLLCPLYPYRMGTNPSREGIGHSGGPNGR